MEAIVRNGYIVFHRNNKYEAGTKIPASILTDVMNTQSWKVEVFQDEKEKRTEDIVDITTNRTMSEKFTKKR
jgi:hypothetical protein